LNANLVFLAVATSMFSQACLEDVCLRVGAAKQMHVHR